jgi:hypothetical protein
MERRKKEKEKEEEKKVNMYEKKEKNMSMFMLTQNVHLAPNTQQAEQAGFTRSKNHETCQSIFREN